MRPKRSKFMGQYFKIDYVDKVIDSDEPDKRLFGMLHDEESVILIRDGMDHEREREVLLHEVTHQLFNMSGIKWSGDQEESVTSFLGAALLSHIRENKKFWSYIMEAPPPDEDD